MRMMHENSPQTDIYEVLGDAILLLEHDPGAGGFKR